MKIYFAYRTGYLPNTRHLKVFEANSILEWFQTHWYILTDSKSDAYAELLGIRVYGIPLWNDEEEIPVPESISELRESIEQYAYCEEVKGNASCLQVLTDDDEIELAWHFFDEGYVNRYPEKTSLWLTPTLPIDFGTNGLKLANKTSLVLPKGTGQGTVYYASSSIYDSSNLEGLEGIYRIDGIRLPQLLDYLRSNILERKSTESYSTTFTELKFLQFLAKQMPTADLKGVLDQASQIPISNVTGSINMDELDCYSLEDILMLDLQNQPAKSVVRASEHLYEWSTNQMGEFYDYFVLFDDVWVEKNEALAKSLGLFFKKWDF